MKKINFFLKTNKVFCIIWAIGIVLILIGVLESSIINTKPWDHSVAVFGFLAAMVMFVVGPFLTIISFVLGISTLVRYLIFKMKKGVLDSRYKKLILYAIINTLLPIVTALIYTSAY